MKWICMSFRCCSFAAFLKCNIIISRFGFHRFQSHWYHSSPFVDSKNKRLVDTLHSQAVKNGSLLNLDVCNHVLNLYVKSKNLDLAQKLFDEIPVRDTQAWTILISGFAQIGSFGMVLNLFREMQMEGICPNQFTLSSVLKCCSSVSNFQLGKGIHGWILRNGIYRDVVLENSMLDLYLKCRVFEYAKTLFELMEKRDTVSWNIMIGAYLQAGDMEKSLDMFRSLPRKDVVSWNTIIDGLMQKGYERNALEQLYHMVENGSELSKFTFSIALVLVSSLLLMQLGRQLHGRVVRLGIHNDGFVRTSLVEMYCKCGRMDKASLILREMHVDSLRKKFPKVSWKESMTEIISWSSMVSGYVWNGKYEDALKIFRSMVLELVVVDITSVTSIISACANAGIMEFGRQTHAYVHKIGHKIDLHLASSFIDMYSKCGCLNDAWVIFRQTSDPNVVLWTSIISGCAFHGQGKEAIRLFEQMRYQGIIPNEVTFVGVLTACSHAGLLKEGCKYFSMMKEVYHIEPGIEHYTCMVDLYGRAGCLNEIKEFIHENGISHLCVIWKSFLSSCRLHKNIEMGKWVADNILQLEPSDAGTYILLSNMYATNHKWEEAARVRSLMRKREVKKHPGQSWMQLKDQVHTFVMGDRSHPQAMEIYAYLDKLIGRVKEIGYSFDVKLVMHDVEEEQGQVLLCHHSEKLALAYAIIYTASGTPIRIMKNLRICTDCHNFMKYTSQLLEREIIVRDIHRFHHFKHGCCSCGDYW
ncbi:Pentatricopeptide repeat-containing protein [Quillaja saponaria]|uniref:Pentatricopeptide repeat-containing protein n=1 Tax=Quillaja saponaria TaxID=32244 RepID=A0AAD7QBI7_QUISA|nr:Pentatricopeptide repeat-containing protein [Quillaja saponaria]